MNNYDRMKAILDSGHGVKLEYALGGTYTIDNIKQFGEHYTIDSATTITPILTKPPILPVSTEVIVLENAVECGDYNDWSENKKNMVGKITKIKQIVDVDYGIYYYLEGKDRINLFPHYCICKAF